MASIPVNEEEILKALGQVPRQQWLDVLHYVRTLQSAPASDKSPASTRTAAELAQSDPCRAAGGPARPGE
jgi:hypothetical protein